VLKHFDGNLKKKRRFTIIISSRIYHTYSCEENSGYIVLSFGGQTMEVNRNLCYQCISMNIGL